MLVEIAFTSHPARLRLLRSVLRDAAALAGLDEARTDALVLAVNEACMNVIQHAYGMEPGGRIELSLALEAGALVVRLRDYAEPVDVDQVRSRDLDDLRPGGLGVYLINTLMDECRFLEPPTGGGNLLEMKIFANTQGGSNELSG
ncbi:MAG TPA: ATP-binding protein [Gammaproteobacteria bacterium]|nr:ATP-binding protein [Gammaproteobacteria bacterium]